MLLAAISVTNPYVQGGMKLKHVALVATALGVYDVIFTAFWPLTNQLVQSFHGYPLDPSMGFRLGFDNAAVGIGDLLVYGLYVNAALKAYGQKAMRFALAVLRAMSAYLGGDIPSAREWLDIADERLTKMSAQEHALWIEAQARTRSLSAASSPFKSRVGSASANPFAWAAHSASSNESPRSMRVRM